MTVMFWPADEDRSYRRSCGQRRILAPLRHGNTRFRRCAAGVRETEEWLSHGGANGTVQIPLKGEDIHVRHRNARDSQPAHRTVKEYGDLHPFPGCGNDGFGGPSRHGRSGMVGRRGSDFFVRGPHFWFSPHLSCVCCVGCVGPHCYFRSCRSSWRWQLAR